MSHLGIWIVVALCCYACWKWVVTDRAAKQLALECRLFQEGLRRSECSYGNVANELHALQIKYDLAMQKFAETYRNKDAVISELDVKAKCAMEALNSCNFHLDAAQAKVADQKATIESQGSRIVNYETNLMTLQRTVERYERMMHPRTGKVRR